MSQSTDTSVTNADVAHDAQKTAKPILITEQEVTLGTRAALSARIVLAPRRWIDAIHNAVGSLHLPPPRPQYATDSVYLEQSRMAREMERL
jgi:hypothetical protein